MTANRSMVFWAIALVSIVAIPATPSGFLGAPSSAPSAGAGGPIASILPVPTSHPHGSPASITPVGGAATGHESLAKEILNRAKAVGISPHDIFLPNFNAQPEVRGNVVHPLSLVAPAPMGLGDFGVRNTSGTAVPYVLQSTSWEGEISLSSATSFLVDTGSPDTFTVQLNTVTTNTTVWGNTTNSFWIQNVFDYTPSTQTLVFLDNIWNFSSTTLAEPASTFYSYNGTPVPSVGFYYDFGGAYTVPMPFSVQLFVNTSTTTNLTALHAWSTVRFGFNILNASGHSVAHGVYDTVLFNSRSSPGLVPLTKFMVNGAKLTPTKFLLYDSEIMIGGPGGGTSATFYNIQGSERLLFLNSSTTRYQNDPTAWNVGTDTGETSEGISEAYTQAGTVDLSGGPSIPVPLWNATPGGNRGQAFIVGHVTPANAFLFASPGATFNQSRAAWAPTNVPYGAEGTPNAPPPTAAGRFNYTLPPGNYTFEAMMSEFDAWNSTLRTTTGSNALNPTLTRDTAVGVYTPLVAWDNAQLANISSSGDGSATHPYVLYNNQYGDLNPLFGELNDYLYAVFPGILLANTNAHVDISQPASFGLTYPSHYDRALARNSLPTTNDLQIQVYNASNVVLWDASSISGWFFNQDYGPAGGLPLANVVFWDVSNSLIAGNTFDSQGSSLVLMNGPGNGGGNIVWGNSFVRATQTAGMLNNGSAVGIFAFESGDLVYNNYVATPVPAAAIPFSEVYGSFQYNLDSWNLPSIEPASEQRTMDGFTLSGSIVGSAWQCGNDWVNWVAGSAVPYTDGGQIYYGGDYCPYPLYPATYPVTFQETGLAGGYWSVSLANATESAAAGAGITFAMPVGNWSYTVPTPPGYAVLSPTPSAVNVTGGTVTVAIRFAPIPPPPPPPMFPATFTESGLTYGSWSVSLGTQTQSAVAGASISFSELAGGYDYAVLNEPGFTVSPSGGHLTFPGAGTVAVVFSAPPPPKAPPTRYAVTFSEGGLATGTAWSVTLNGTTQSSFGSSITFSVPNGSYGYSAGSVPDYTLGLSPGTATVNGAPITIAVGFAPDPGTLSGTVNVNSATLTENGNSIPLTAGAFSVSLPPGSYTVLVTAGGYAPYSNTVVVAPGHATQLSITLTALPSQTQALSSAQTDGIIGAIIVLAVAVLVAGFLMSRGRNRGGGSPPMSPPAASSEVPAGPKAPTPPPAPWSESSADREKPPTP